LTLSIKALSKTPFSIMTLSISLRGKTHSIMTYSIKHSTNDTQHDIILNVAFFIDMSSVVMLGVVVLTGAAPQWHLKADHLGASVIKLYSV